MLVTTKNTFIDVQEVDSSIPALRPRRLSCPPIFDTCVSDCESLDTATTAESSMNSACKQFLTRIVVSKLPRLMDNEAVLQVVRCLSVRACVNVSNIDVVPCTAGTNKIAYITIDKPNDAMRLFQLLHGGSFGCHEVDVKMEFLQQSNESIPKRNHKKGETKIPQSASRRHGARTSNKLFIGGLKSATQARCVRSYFSKFGEIKDCGIVYDFNGVSRRFGYCEFICSEAVDAVLDYSGTHRIDGVAVAVRGYCLRS